MTFRRPPHYFFGKPLLWVLNHHGLRYRIELVMPVERDEAGRLAFLVLEGPKQGELVYLDDDDIAVFGHFRDAIWSVP